MFLSLSRGSILHGVDREGDMNWFRFLLCIYPIPLGIFMLPLLADDNNGNNGNKGKFSERLKKMRRDRLRKKKYGEIVQK